MPVALRGRFPSPPQFRTVNIDANVTIGYGVAAEDIGGDGKAEIAVGAGWNPTDTPNSGAAFYLIPPFDRTHSWEPVRLSHEPTFNWMSWVHEELG